ncbi:putative glutamine-dependent NAD(+) synthetase [Homarus americanus]|uniref:putative glutamine-dependent NAD(+) synthetase n=1 Tax=Homarus americanus TaxID=6706 RepID=UPI001C45ACE9|nr:putative glutamine-dependent NAD(+) synthetase [Homarus americanus]
MWSRGRKGEMIVLASTNKDTILAGSWAKYGDSSADVNLIGHFPKKEIEKALLLHAKDKLNLQILQDIVPSTAKEDEAKSLTEDEESIVMTNLQTTEYCGPYSMFGRLIYLWRNRCSPKEVGEKVKSFFQQYSFQRPRRTVVTTSYYISGNWPTV